MIGIDIVPPAGSLPIFLLILRMFIRSGIKA
jgi:hypothetical protein